MCCRRWVALHQSSGVCVYGVTAAPLVGCVLACSGTCHQGAPTCCHAHRQLSARQGTTAAAVAVLAASRSKLLSLLTPPVACMLCCVGCGQAVVQVDEAGTEAAAVTSVLGRRSAPPTLVSAALTRRLLFALCAKPLISPARVTGMHVRFCWLDTHCCMGAGTSLLEQACLSV